MKRLSVIAVMMTSMVSINTWASNDQNLATEKATNASSEFTPQQRAAIVQITHDYLLQHPEVLVEAAQALQAKQAQQLQKQAKTAIVKNKMQLFQDAATPTGGNPNGEVAVVEFFDYQCGHCKEMAPVIEKILAANPNVKIIYKELPIFGENSEYAAKAALAANKQGKFKEFHQALFAVGSGGLTAEKVMSIAKSVGLNTTQLAQDMKDPAIDKQMKDNFSLAQQLRLEGTPSFVYANKTLTNFDFVPGATSEQDMQNRIKQFSGEKKSTE